MKKTLTLSISAVLLASSMSALAAPEQPKGKLECIAPADPGGGWDFTCRQFASALRQEGLIDKGMQTVNMTGAAGGVAFAHVVSKREGDAGLIVAASSSNATRLAQNQYPGMDENDVTWIGTLGADYAVIAARSDYQFDSINGVVDSIKDNPKSVKFAGGSGILGWDQLNLLQVLNSGGVKVDSLKKLTYLDFNNGATAITQILGGHLDVVVGDMSEVTSFLESGDLKVLAVLSEKRLPAPYDQLLTAKEQGIDVVAPNWRGFYMPAGVSEDERQYWVNNLNAVYESDYWKDIMKKNALSPFNITGPQLDEFLSHQIGEIRSIFEILR